MRPRAALPPAAAALAALALAACGGGDDGSGASTTASPAEDPGAAEASPEAPPEVPQSEGGDELSGDDRDAVEAAAIAYVEALSARDGAAVCATLAPGAVRVGELPARAGGCAASVEASLGTRPRAGGPAWRRTSILAVTAVSVGEDRARVTARVRHRFSDRSYVSVEEDVIYLDRGPGGAWLLAKPSGSFYRAVGYPEPPLRALAPPRG